MGGMFGYSLHTVVAALHCVIGVHHASRPEHRVQRITTSVHMASFLQRKMNLSSLSAA